MAMVPAPLRAGGTELVSLVWSGVSVVGAEEREIKFLDGGRRDAHGHRWWCHAQPSGEPQPKELRALVQAAQKLGAKLREWDPGNGDPVKCDRITLDFAIEELNKRARSAARAGYWGHPLVQEWAAGRRSLGDREALRALKNKIPGAAAGISVVLDPTDIWLRLLVEDIEADTQEPLTLAQLQERVRERLRADGWLPPVMRTGLVYEAPSRMDERRDPDGDAHFARMQAAIDSGKRLRNELDARLSATAEAFRLRLVRLGLHEPKFRRS
jgi:hypothetical protein